MKIIEIYFKSIVVMMLGLCVGGNFRHQRHDNDGRGALDYVRYATFHIELNVRGIYIELNVHGDSLLKQS
jgi:hypothetical protein